MKYKKGMYLLDRSNGEIIKLLERVAIYPDIKIEKWRFESIKNPIRQKFIERHHYLKTEHSTWKVLTKTDLILLGVKDEI